MTFASVILLSGLWALWYTPTSTYEYRRNEQIVGINFALQPGNSTTKMFVVNEEVDEIRVGIWPQTIPDAPYDPAQPEIQPVISIRIHDPQGKVVRSYDNIASLSDGESIAVDPPGTFKVDVSNNHAENVMRIELDVPDVTKVPNHPLEAMGQWLTIISLPVFGLAVWFAIRSRQKPVNGNIS
ncbi:MAG TPA: hypothetical protein VD736_05970 [Nitrososphaera sp.]|nr:hypothetical protein [Nitrososphaera sp.]